MKKIIYLLTFVILSSVTYSQTIVNSKTIIATKNLVAPLDTLINPNYLGEIRRRSQDTSIYQCISLTLSKRWQRITRDDRLGFLSNTDTTGTALLVASGANAEIKQLFAGPYISFTTTAKSVTINNTGIGSIVTYSPTITSVTNITGTPTFNGYYQQVGDAVVIFGEITFDPTSTGDTQVDLSLPIASAISNSYDASGTGAADDILEPVRIYFNNSGGRIAIRTTVTSTSQRTYSVIIRYKITPP